MEAETSIDRVNTQKRQKPNKINNMAENNGLNYPVVVVVVYTLADVLSTVPACHVSFW